MSTVTSTTTSVDPADSMEVGLPMGKETRGRPWLRVPSEVYITMPATADAVAAATWWRQLAANAVLVAQWYEHEITGGAR